MERWWRVLITKDGHDTITTHTVTLNLLIENGFNSGLINRCDVQVMP